MSARRRTEPRKCGTPGCGRPVLCAGLCGACYSWHSRMRWRAMLGGVSAVREYVERAERTAARIASWSRKRPP